MPVLDQVFGFAAGGDETAGETETAAPGDEPGSAIGELVIDPDLTWLTNLGGADLDTAWAIDAQDDGIVTVAGVADSGWEAPKAAS